MSHIRAIEILNQKFDWRSQTSKSKAEIFQSWLDNPHQLRRARKGWRGKSEHDIMDWNPRMYLLESEHLQIYCNYFPLIINCTAGNKVSGLFITLEVLSKNSYQYFCKVLSM